MLRGCRFCMLVVVIQVLSGAVLKEVGADADYENAGMPEVVREPSDEEYLRHILSMLSAYQKSKDDDQTVIETNALINTKYRTWKRNADLINSLLALPKALNDAGR